MRYTKAEARHFYWHCVTAAFLIEKLQRNTATNAHVTHAIRMATLTALGKEGVQYASRGALERRGAPKGAWTGLGLIKEHVIPVSVIAEEARAACKSATPHTWREIVDFLTDDDREHWKIIDSDFSLDAPADLAAVIGAIVRKSAKLAWITREENKLLSDKGLTKSMPPDHAGDPIARYKTCDIELLPLAVA